MAAPKNREKETLKPLPSCDGMDDEQLRQLARELHAAIDKVSIFVKKFLKQSSPLAPNGEDCFF